jgi:rhamnose transport system permease protein
MPSSDPVVSDALAGGVTGGGGPSVADVAARPGEHTSAVATSENGAAAGGGTPADLDLHSLLPRRPLALLTRWEGVLVLFVLGTVLFGVAESPNFLTGTNFFDFGLDIGPIAIMALPLMLIVMVGEIDLSVASTLGLSCSLLGYLFAHGWPIEGAMAFVLAVGFVCGTFNGLLVTRLGLPSLAVTIGTLTLYRGIALIVLGSNTITGFPTSFTNAGVNPLWGTELSWTLGVFLVLALVFGVVLHATPLGRSLYAIGLHEETAYFSGIRVKRIKTLLFSLSGVVCALVGILWTFQYATASSDAGTGLELDVVTLVLFGGVSIFGGRGTVVGVVMAVCVLGGIDSALTLVNVSAQVQNIVTGVLLLISVILPNSAEGIGRIRARIARERSRE